MLAVANACVPILMIAINTFIQNSRERASVERHRRIEQLQQQSNDLHARSNLILSLIFIVVLVRQRVKSFILYASAFAIAAVHVL